MSDLHGDIMNLPCDPSRSPVGGVNAELAYKSGHRDARHAAAELVAAHEAELSQLRAENKEIRALLGEKVADSTRLRELAMKDGGVTISLEGGACALIAQAFGKQLFESEASNYIEASFESPDYPGLGQITVTLKRETGKTPHQLRKEAEAERDALRKDAERYRWLMRELGGSVSQAVTGTPFFSNESVDEAIDHAMQGKQP